MNRFERETQYKFSHLDWYKFYDKYYSTMHGFDSIDLTGRNLETVNDDAERDGKKGDFVFHDLDNLVAGYKGWYDLMRREKKELYPEISRDLLRDRNNSIEVRFGAFRTVLIELLKAGFRQDFGNNEKEATFHATISPLLRLLPSLETGTQFLMDPTPSNYQAYSSHTVDLPTILKTHSLEAKYSLHSPPPSVNGMFLAFWNFVGNASKFIPEDSIREMYIRYNRRNGIMILENISESELTDDIIGAGVRGNSDKTGRGNGMTIADHIATLHGIKIHQNPSARLADNKFMVGLTFEGIKP